MRSVAVVLPASMCAEIPMFRYRSMGVVRAILRRFAPPLHGVEATPSDKTIWGRAGDLPAAGLPAVVRERLVGLGHPVRVLALAYRGSAILGCLQQFSGQAVSHGFLAAIGSRLDDPAHGERLAAVGAHFHRHLIRGAADAPRLDLDHR